MYRESHRDARFAGIKVFPQCHGFGAGWRVYASDGYGRPPVPWLVGDLLQAVVANIGATPKNVEGWAKPLLVKGFGYAARRGMRVNWCGSNGHFRSAEMPILFWHHCRIIF